MPGDNINVTIPFNRPPRTGHEDCYVLEAMNSGKISGDGPFGIRCQKWFERHIGCAKALLTPSCTHALEMAAILADIGPGDEVIMPSYTFVSTANAFVLRGATPVFVDIRSDTLNLDEALIEAAITPRTRAIVPVHYAGVGCAMESIMALAERYRLIVIEDAAQGMMASYRERPLGAIGHLGCYSFHETKNYTSGGEGGLLIVNDARYVERAEIIREKGTNRSQFFRGMVDKYSWVDIGSSCLASELQAAFLWGQLEHVDKVNDRRLALWQTYWDQLTALAEAGHIQMPTVPEDCGHNAHMFHLRCADLSERTQLIEHLGQQQIQAVFHYVPLHSAAAGRRFGRFHGEDRWTTRESERLVRLPLWYGMNDQELQSVVTAVHNNFR